MQQVFERFRATTPVDVADARFEHFTRVVWPRLKDACGSGGMLLFVPHYFDFVRCVCASVCSSSSSCCYCLCVSLCTSNGMVYA